MHSLPSIAENIADLRRRIAHAASRASRDPADITLLAVTNAQGGFTGSSVFTNVACGLGTTGAQYTYVDGSGVHASASVTLDCS